MRGALLRERGRQVLQRAPPLRDDLRMWAAGPAVLTVSRATQVGSEIRTDVMLAHMIREVWQHRADPVDDLTAGTMNRQQSSRCRAMYHPAELPAQVSKGTPLGANYGYGLRLGLGLGAGLLRQRADLADVEALLRG